MSLVSFTAKLPSLGPFLLLSIVSGLSPHCQSICPFSPDGLLTTSALAPAQLQPEFLPHTAHRSFLKPKSVYFVPLLMPPAPSTATARLTAALRMNAACSLPQSARTLQSACAYPLPVPTPIGSLCSSCPGLLAGPGTHQLAPTPGPSVRRTGLFPPPFAHARHPGPLGDSPCLISLGDRTAPSSRAAAQPSPSCCSSLHISDHRPVLSWSLRLTCLGTSAPCGRGLPGPHFTAQGPWCTQVRRECWLTRECAECWEARSGQESRAKLLPGDPETRLS